MGKYRYESSWKDLQKEFPNYDFTKYVNETSKIWCLNNISNELAEANRLKRIELECIRIYKYGQCNINTEYPKKEQLDDQA